MDKRYFVPGRCRERELGLIICEKERGEHDAVLGGNKRLPTSKEGEMGLLSKRRDAW